MRGQVIRQVLNESIQPQAVMLNIHVRRSHVYLFIIWLSWSALKRSFLIGSLSGSNFSIRTTKIDRSRKDLNKSCFGKILEGRTVLYEVETLFFPFVPITLVKTTKMAGTDPRNPETGDI